MWPLRRLRTRSTTHTPPTRRVGDVHDSVRVAIAAGLDGGDTALAWTAVWDLAHSTNTAAKQDILTMLRDYVEVAVQSPMATHQATAFFGGTPPFRTHESIDQVDDLWSKIEFACDVEAALAGSLSPQTARMLPSREVVRQYEQAQQAANDKALRDMGVRGDEGMPMWALYMTRRSKRVWG